MRKSLLVLAVVAALCVPVAALADNAAPSASTAAAQVCKADLVKMGAATFALTYRNFGACVRKSQAQAQQNLSNAAHTCKAQENDPNFATTNGGKTFAQVYGSNSGNGNGKGTDANAFGKCVSAQAQQQAQNEAAATNSAAKLCKNMHKNDPASFSSTYGSGRNAFGKCVAAKTTSS